MRRAFILILILVVSGLAAATFGQSTSSDSQTLQAVLTEVRGLRQDLQASLGRIQSAQILLSRLQIQEVAVTRASQHLDEVRSKLAEVEVVLKSEEAEIKHLEDEAPNGGDRTAQVEEWSSALNPDFRSLDELEQQRQTAELDAEQHCEQRTTNRLESQLDELVKNMGNRSEQSDCVPLICQFAVSFQDRP